MIKAKPRAWAKATGLEEGKDGIDNCLNPIMKASDIQIIPDGDYLDSLIYEAVTSSTANLIYGGRMI